MVHVPESCDDAHTSLCRFFIGAWHQAGFLAEDRPTHTLRSILTRLKETYCSRIGFEYMHIPDSAKCDWIREKIETIAPLQYSQKEKLQILDRVAWSEMFETFLANKYSSAKRFGLEGGETLIPGMKHLIDVAADMGVENVVMGMPHRGARRRGYLWLFRLAAWTCLG